MSDFQLRQAARIIAGGGVVACPTEAVYGLSCDPLNPLALQRVLRIKNRPVLKGLILAAADVDQLAPFIDTRNIDMQPALDSWPGPETWILPAAADVPGWITGGRDTIACRVTAHPTMSGLCRAAKRALISTSANRSGQAPARTPLQVRLRCPGADQILHAPLGKQAKPTRIRDARTGEQLR